MPMVTVNYVREKLGADASERKAAIAAKVAEAVAEGIGVASGDVWVVFNDVGAADWYVGHESVAERLRKPA